MTTTYVAFLRGINVGGRSAVKMADLRRVVTDLGHGDVGTYIQSGNVVFTSHDDDVSRLARKLESAIAAELAVSPQVLVLSRQDLDAVIMGNPFAAAGADVSSLHVTLLDGPPTAGLVDDLLALPTGDDEVAVLGRALYLRCPHGYGRTALSNTVIERRLKLAATTRSMKTLLRVAALAEQVTR